MKWDNLYWMLKAEPDHLKQIKEIEIECGLSNWSAADYSQEMARRDSFFQICKIDDDIAGFILARLIMYKKNHLEILKNEETIFNTNNFTIQTDTEPENEVEIYNIGVRRKYRRTGVGAFLFRELLEKSRQNNVRKIWLEVRISNRNAIAFYESEGFKITGTRKNLYTNPSEDGFIMCLNL